MQILIIGCGQIGTDCARMLRASGHSVSGLRRNGSRLPDWMGRISADVLDKDALTLVETIPADIVIYQVAASAFNEDAYRGAYVTGLNNCIERLSNRAIPLLFVSSTSVYHQDDGSWVDESSVVQPQSFNGQIMLEAENIVAQLPGSASIRFSGIYGPQRLRMIERVKAGGVNLDTEGDGVMTNRIHSADCAAVLSHLTTIHLNQDLPRPPLWLASDCEPATRSEVFTFIREELAVGKTDRLDSRKTAATATSTAGHASSSRIVDGGKLKRRAGSKRCSNRQLIDSGYRFRYPDYRSGYRQVIANLEQ